MCVLMCECVCKYMFVYGHVCMHVCVSICLCSCVCMVTCVCVRLHVYFFVCAYVVCTCACVRAWVCNINVDVYITSTGCNDINNLECTRAKHDGGPLVHSWQADKHTHSVFCTPCHICFPVG